MATFTTTNQPLPWVQPYAQDYLGRAQDVANQGYQQSPGNYVGPNDYLQKGWAATADRAMQGSPVMGAANEQLQNTIGGGFMDRQATQNQSAGASNPFASQSNPFGALNNPYLSQSIADAQGDLTRSWNQVQKPAWDTAMQRSGSFGNTGIMQANGYAADELQRNLGRIGTDARMGAYNQSAQLAENQLGRQFQSGENMANRRFQAGESLAGRQDTIGSQERGFMQQALGMAPAFAQNDYMDSNALLNIGQQAQAFRQGAQDQNQRWFQEAQQFPRDQLGLLGNALGMQQGGTTTQSQPDPSKASQIIGGAMVGSQLAPSVYQGLLDLFGG